jgi:hypothetical protein
MDMTQLLVAAGVVAVALGVAAVLRHRRSLDPPTQVVYRFPQQLDPADLGGSQPWKVVVFSSATCATCADISRKAAVLASDHVEVIDIEFAARKDLHEKYGIDAVPIVVVADERGVVHRGFVGPVSATDLWAAVADARSPGSSPEPTLGQELSGR